MTLYSKYLALRNEILKHKWIESEKNNKILDLKLH